MNWYLISATILMTVHATLIISVFISIGLSIRYPWLRLAESVLLLVTVTIWAIFGACPLTILENYLRQLGGAPRPLMTIGFIPYYLNHWLGIHTTDAVVTTGTIAVTVLFIGLALYWFVRNYFVTQQKQVSQLS